MSNEIRIILDEPKMVCEWVYSRIDRNINIQDWVGYQGIGIGRHGKLIGGVIFHDMTHGREDVEMTVVGYGAFFTEEVANFLAWNAFDNLRVTHVTSRCAEDNIRSPRLFERFGFKYEGRQRKTWDGKRDCLLYGLLKDDYGRKR